MLGIVLDSNLINIFSLTYPLQCLMGIIIAIFGVGANITAYKDSRMGAIDSGIAYGTILSIMIFGMIILNCDNYIGLMNMDKTIYKTFCIYSIFQILCHTLLHLIITKLYYKDENRKANKISIMFNIINFTVLISTAIITKNQFITALVTAIVMLVMVVVLYVINLEKIDFKLNIMNCFKYNSVQLVISIMYLIMYLFGFSNAFEYGEKYMVAITFTTLVTDMQWDITEAIKTVAKIDITKKCFVYNDHLKNARKLFSLLIISVILLSFVAYPFYRPDLRITSIFLSLHILDFVLCPAAEIKICFLQLEDSSSKMTLNMIVAYILRTFMSFTPTPYCTVIGQICSTVYKLICTKINFRKYEDKIIT